MAQKVAGLWHSCHVSYQPLVGSHHPNRAVVQCHLKLGRAPVELAIDSRYPKDSRYPNLI